MSHEIIGEDKLHYLETGHCPFYAKDAIFLIDKEVLNVS